MSKIVRRGWNWGESKGCLIKGCLNSTKIPKVGIPKAGIPKVGIPKTGIPKEGIPKVGKTHTGTLPETVIPTPGIPKSGVPNIGIPKAEIPKLGIPKTGSFTAPLIQTPLRLPLMKTQFSEMFLAIVAYLVDAFVWWLVGVFRGNTIRGNTTCNSERKMALWEGLWEGLWKTSENL